MNEFTVIFQDKNGNELPLPNGLTVVPLRYSEMAVGGFDVADLEIHGNIHALWSLLQWLGYRIVIQNRNKSPVWWGYIDEIMVGRGALQDGLSLKNMFNRVAVAYTFNDLGNNVSGTTSWAEDTESIARYGRKELLLSLSDTNLAQAESKRDTKLNNFKKPTPIQRAGVGGNTTVATVRCSGYWHTLGWRYYEQLHGLEDNDESGGDQAHLGLGFTSSTVSFSKSGKVSDHTGNFEVWPTGIYVKIAGSASNNGTFKVETADNNPTKTYTATTIRFDPSDDIHDSAEGLGFLEDDEFFSVTGAGDAANNGVKRINEQGTAHITVYPATIVGESAGASVTLTRGNSIELDATLTTAAAGASVTITAHGQEVAQSFTVSAAGLSWTVDKILIRLRKIGAPTDNVTVELCTDSAAAPGAVLDSVNVPYTSIPGDMDWVTFDLANTQTITAGTTYWIVVSRTGANQAKDYYEIDVDEDILYTNGVLKLWDGAAYVARVPDADMIFRVLGAWETTRQITQMVTDVGDSFTATDLIHTSGIYTNQYRDGKTKALDELVDLLESGTTNDRRLLAKVTIERILRIYEQPAQTAEAQILQAEDGSLRNLAGQPLEHGRLCAGQWIERTDIPQTVAALTKLSPFFAERCEYDCQRNTMRIEPQGTASAYDVGTVVQG